MKYSLVEVGVKCAHFTVQAPHLTLEEFLGKYGCVDLVITLADGCEESNEPIATGSIGLAAACLSNWQIFVLLVSMSFLRLGVLCLTLTAAMRQMHHETGRDEVEGDQLCCCHKTIPPVEICVKGTQVFEKKDLSWPFMWFQFFFQGTFLGSHQRLWPTNNPSKRFSSHKTPPGFWGCFSGEATVVQCLHYGAWDLGAWGRSS